MNGVNTVETQAMLAAMLNDRYPDERGRFGPYGGRYVPETLVPALNRLQEGVELIDVHAVERPDHARHPGRDQRLPVATRADRLPHVRAGDLLPGPFVEDHDLETRVAQPVELGAAPLGEQA